MLEVVRIMYKELYYQMLKRNPMLSEEKLIRSTKKFSIKRRIATTSAFFFIFGLFLGGSAILGDRYVISTLSVTLTLITFVFTFYATAVNSSHAISMGVFEPLKFLPLRIQSSYLSQLLILDSIPCFAASIPTISIIATKYPVQSIFLLLWVLLGILVGHTFGLMVLAFFGVRVSYRRTKVGFLRATLKIIGLILFVGGFYALSYFQRYISEKSSEFAQTFWKYSIFFPFSASLIFDWTKNLLAFSVYLILFVLLYNFALKKVWFGIYEPKVFSENAKPSRFKAGFGGQMTSLVKKDLRLVFRKVSMAVGFFIPFYFILPQIFMAVKTGKFTKELALNLVCMISFFSSVNADIVLRVESKEVEFLRSLPLKKSDFVIGKVISISIVSISSSVIMVGISSLYDTTSILVLPHSIFLPLATSLLTMYLLYRYGSEEIGIPERSTPKTFLLFLANLLLIAIVAIPAIFLKVNGWLVSYSILIAIFLILLYKIFRL
ncbi:hypothetical protein B6U96_12450 [Archaeoglobales archaeon ex4484_92]|nr:MAG: hypothetical protein B6U96_12450 [Archaeoglobales archaeon ex4484_92]